MKFTFNHCQYKSPMVQNSEEDYSEEIGSDHALVIWSDENVSAITGDLQAILKEAQEDYFNEWNEDHGFAIPCDTSALIAYCESTELDCDSSYGFALVDIKNTTILGQPWNSRIYFH